MLRKPIRPLTLLAEPAPRADLDHVIVEKLPPILATKLMPPRRAPGLIRRERLLALIDQVRAEPLPVERLEDRQLAVKLPREHLQNLRTVFRGHSRRYGRPHGGGWNHTRLALEGVGLPELVEHADQVVQRLYDIELIVVATRHAVGHATR